ncbi:hypothetical protein ACTFIY_001196 [Dictyostelium cf. discoideum]
MNNNNFIINLIIIVFFIKLIKGLTITIDLNSNVTYNQVSCGLDYLNFPPCKSFADAGIRSRYISFNESMPISLVFELINFDWRNKIITKNIEIGEIRNYCFFEIRVKDEPNAIISIDGSDYGNYSFFEYQTPYFASQCENFNNTIGLKLRNIKFIDWNYNQIISLKTTKYYYPKPILVYFQSIFVESIRNEIFSSGSYSNHLLIDSCTFSNLNRKVKSHNIFSGNSMIITNSTFKNILSNFSLYNTMNNNHTITNCIFNNITIYNGAPFINTLSSGLLIDNITISNSIFSVLIRNTIQSIFIGFGEISLNNIKFIRNNLFKSFQVFLIPEHTSFLNFVYDNIDDEIVNLDIILNNISFIDNINFRENLPFSFNFLKTRFVRNINFTNTLIPKIFTNSVYSMNAFINVNNGSSFQSKIILKGSNNIINYQNYQENITNSFYNNINNNCFNCTVYPILKNNINNSNNTNENFNQTDSNNFENNNDSDNNQNFKKILILPIVLGSIIVIVIIGFVILLKTKKIKFFKKENGTGEKGGKSNIEMGDIGQINNNELATNENIGIPS